MGAAGDIETLTRQLAVELAPRDPGEHRCGGLIETDSLHHLPEGAAMAEFAAAHTPLGRVGHPNIARAVALRGRRVGDKVLVVDGGLGLL